MAYLCNNGDYEVPLRGTFSLDSTWTKLRGSSTLLHGLTNEVGSSTRPASSKLTQLWFRFGVFHCGKQERGELLELASFVL